jgi:outer membrane protein OmpA-like peptidoglycan-associated protein
MKRLHTAICLLFAWSAEISFCQDNTASAQLAPLNVIVTSTKGVVLKGEEVLFISEKDNKQYSGKTNNSGKFSLSLPSGSTYIIKLKKLTDTTKYSSFNIPELQPGQFYKDPFTVTIKFDPARVYTLNNVQFDFGKPTLQPGSFKELDEIVDYMKYKENERYEIGGHTDNIGNEADNQKLSEERAKAVRDYLIKNGIAPSRLIAKGYGSSHPVADNDTEEGRQKNRRTEVTIL